MKDIYGVEQKREPGDVFYPRPESSGPTRAPEEKDSSDYSYEEPSGQRCFQRKVFHVLETVDLSEQLGEKSYAEIYFETPKWKAAIHRRKFNEKYFRAFGAGGWSTEIHSCEAWTVEDLAVELAAKIKELKL